MNAGFKTALVCACAGLNLCARGGEANTNAPAAQRVAAFKLEDQYRKEHAIEFPLSKPMVITIADRTSSADVGAWVTPLKARYEDRVQIAGVADVAAVPVFLHGTLRSQFKKDCPYPVMLDWKGGVVKQLGGLRGVLKVLVVAPDGSVLLELQGRPDEAGFKRLYAVLDARVAALEVQPRNLPSAGR